MGSMDVRLWAPPRAADSRRVTGCFRSFCLLLSLTLLSILQTMATVAYQVSTAAPVQILPIVLCF
jgi:hypothetical protein